MVKTSERKFKKVYSYELGIAHTILSKSKKKVFTSRDLSEEMGVSIIRANAILRKLNKKGKVVLISRNHKIKVVTEITRRVNSYSVS